MCISPVSIPNPNKHLREPYKNNSWFMFKDVDSEYISVPCGHCPDCIANKQMQFVQRVQMEALGHHIFFATLTYNDEMIPRITSSNGFTFKYADLRDIHCMMQLIRKYNDFGRPFKYTAVSERGSQHGRPHWHLLFFVDKEPGDNFMTITHLESTLYNVVKSRWCRNVGSTHYPIYVPLFTFHCKKVSGKVYCNFDLHYVNSMLSDAGEADVAFYVSKYVMKDSTHEQRIQQALHMNLDLDEYEALWKLIKSRRTCSKDFGDSKNPAVRSYIRSCLDREPSQPYPTFINPTSGQTFPLARFYRQNFLTMKDLCRITDKFPLGIDNVRIKNVDEVCSYDSDLRKVARFSENEKRIFSHDVVDLM